MTIMDKIKMLHQRKIMVKWASQQSNMPQEHAVTYMHISNKEILFT